MHMGPRNSWDWMQLMRGLHSWSLCPCILDCIFILTQWFRNLTGSVINVVFASREERDLKQSLTIMRTRS